MDWQAIGLSVQLSVCTSLLLLVMGLPVAYWLATTPWRGRIFLEAVIALPLILPPSVLGLYVLLTLGPKGVPGRWYEALTGSLLPFSFQGLLVASVLYSLPFALQPFTTAFRAIDHSLLDSARVSGASSFQAFRLISVPLAWPGILSGIVLSFAHTLGEFGVVLMVGGNIKGVTRTISISIYDQVQSLDYAGAARNSLFLLVVSFAVLSLTYSLQKSFQFFNAGR